MQVAMEPNYNNIASNPELPEPQTNESSLSEVTQSMTRENSPKSVSSPTVSSISHAPSPDPHSQQLSDTNDNSQLIADDADLIEKEWVTKAKEIVGQTKNDPYKQNQSINKVKAEYIKKRYNKDLKVTES